MKAELRLQMLDRLYKTATKREKALILEEAARIYASYLRTRHGDML